MTLKTYTQDEVDELLQAENQAGYDFGYKTGRVSGIREAMTYIETESATAFTARHDDDAMRLRNLVDRMKTKIPFET